MNRISIDRKITLFVILVMCVMGVLVLTLFLLGVWTMRFNTIGQRQQREAMIFATLIKRQIDNEVETLIGHSDSLYWKDAIQEANLNYVNWKREAIEDYMVQMDREWISAEPAEPVIQERLNSRLSRRLKTLSGIEEDIGEIFCTDKYGGLVAASGKTSDFYQADETWWQRAYNNGKGNIFFGDIELDASIGKYSSTVAIPIKDETGQVIGVTKAVLDLSVFFQPLKEYRFEKTGLVEILDAKGNVIFSPHLKPYGKSEYSKKKLDRLLTSRNRYALLAGDFSKTNKSVAVAEIKGDLFEANGINWVVIVSQSEQELFVPLYKIFAQGSLLVAIFLFIVVLIMHKYFYKVFIFPFQEIKQGVKLFSEGNLSHRIDIRLGSEFEQLAESLNQMSVYLEQTLVSRDDLATEVTRRRQAQEALDTKLKEAVEARSIMISMLEDNNHIRERLEKSLVDLKQAQLMIIQSEKLEALGMIASGIAHEVKNPLGVILQGINYFEEIIPQEKEEARNILQLLKNNIARADNIIRSLLDYSRVEKLEMKLEDINVLIEKSLNLLKHTFKLNNIKVEKVLQDGIPKILIDAGKIEQALVNIFSNASDAMPKGGTLTLRSYLTQFTFPQEKILPGDLDFFSANEKILIIEAEDTGEGISEDNMKRIFEPFFTTKGPGKGTGLGLSVTRSIIEMQRGQIELTSQVAKGTKVIIRFKTK